MSNLSNISTIVKVKTIKGTSFVGVRNYKNSQGEVSNQTFLVGISYANLLKNDLDKLTNFDLKPIFAKYPENRLEVTKAYNELLTSLVKRTSTEEEKEQLRKENDLTIRQSDAQTNAYTTVAKGLRAKDGILYVYGLRVKKTVLESVEYAKTNSRLKTIIKNDIKKQAELRGEKFRQFKLGFKETLNIQGAEISASE